MVIDLNRLHLRTMHRLRRRGHGWKGVNSMGSRCRLMGEVNRKASRDLMRMGNLLRS
jgi:hypothetical protein